MQKSNIHLVLFSTEGEGKDLGLNLKVEKNKYSRNFRKFFKNIYFYTSSSLIKQDQSWREIFYNDSQNLKNLIKESQII